MIDYNFQLETYFESESPTAMLAKITYPETQWGEEVRIYVNAIDGGELYYEAVDFYGNEIKLTPDHSSIPLSLQEMIFMIETMEVEKENIEDAKFKLMGLPEVESNFYPDLNNYFSEKRNVENKSKNLG